MKRCFLYLIPYICLYLIPAFAQESPPSPEDGIRADVSSVFPPSGDGGDSVLDSSDYFHPKLLHPVIGIGPGILTFYGDISDKRAMPSISRVGYNLSVSEYLSRSILFSACALFGTLGANENNARNMNFESSIRLGGVNFVYNFDHFLPPKRRMFPFVLSGFEYFEYLSKTDLFDSYGNQYHYWSDGSIMNLEETDPNVFNAIPLLRDYKYETDIRKWNNSLFGKYPERSYAIPVGLGVNLHLTPRWTFKLGTTLHFSFTDYMDGVTTANKGNEKGNNKKDKFLETYFTLTFNLFNPKPPYLSPLSDDEFLALLNEDTDGDGITDFNDSCQGTPPGVPVNAKGCPADSDSDGMPDYTDKEVNSPLGAVVDKDGVAMDDSTIARNWHLWSDSTEEYIVFNLVVNPPAIAPSEYYEKTRTSTIVYRREFVILLGIYEEGIPPDEMGKLLTVPDVRSSMQPDATIAYTAGSYNRATDAEKRKNQMIGGGFPNAKVMIRNKDGDLAPPPPEGKAPLYPSFADGGNTGNASALIPPSGGEGAIYRVQLGAYSQKLSSSIFHNADAIIELKTEDGLYKYMSGSYTSIQDALQQRDELLKKGYHGAFVVAYKDNNRVPLSSVSKGIIRQMTDENIEDPKTPVNAVDKNLISFRIQLGVFVNEPPPDIMQKFNKVPGLEKKKKPSGVTQYFTGKFNNYQEAQMAKESIVNKYGIADAFMVAFFKDQLISVQEAVELLK